MVDTHTFQTNLQLISIAKMCTQNVYHFWTASLSTCSQSECLRHQM